MKPLFFTEHKSSIKIQEGKYNIIYADPPWKYDNKIPNGAADHYDVMNLEDLKNLPVNKISSDDCVLFMWVVFPMLQEGLDLIKSWGFTYKTIAFNWVKTTKNNSLFWGEGSWTRANSEICLLGVKGRMKSISHDILSVVLSEVREHSQKPDIIREDIVKLCGDLPRIELFARQMYDGWGCFGNEVSDSIQLQ